MQNRSMDPLPRPQLMYLVFQGVLLWVAVVNMEPLLYLPLRYPLSVALLWLLMTAVFFGSPKVGRAWKPGVVAAVWTGAWIGALALLPLPYVSTLVGSEERPGYLPAFAAGFFLYCLPFAALAFWGLLMELADWLRQRDAQQT